MRNKVVKFGNKEILVVEKKINSLRVSNIGILRHPRPVMSI